MLVQQAKPHARECYGSEKNQPEETTRPKPKAKAKSEVKKTIEKDKPETPRPAHNIAKDTNTDPQYWSKKSTTIAYIKNQLEQHHGARFTKTQIKGFKKEDQSPRVLKPEIVKMGTLNKNGDPLGTQKLKKLPMGTHVGAVPIPSIYLYIS